MALIHYLRQSAFGSVLKRPEDVQCRRDTFVVYVGLGDQFDDDRRLVREAALTSSLPWPISLERRHAR
jgi:hypothetical protein